MIRLMMASAALAVAVCGAQAATIQQTSTLPGSSTSDFTAPMLTATMGTVYNDISGSVDGLYRSPFDTTPYQNAAYSSVEGNGSAYYNASGNQFSLIWGSPDSYNQLEFFSGAGGTGSLLSTISGSSIAPANGTGYSYVTISDVGNFGSVVLLNNPNANAFEVSTFSVSSVPLPASLPMFGGAVAVLGTIGAVLRRRNTTARA